MNGVRFILVGLLALLALSVSPEGAAAATFTVDTTAATWPDDRDSDTEDGVCDNGAGLCPLRAAIEQANASLGTDTISFSIGAGVQTISPNEQLPTISDPVIIDGTTQPGFAGSPIIELDGDGRIPLRISAGNSTVKGLVINNSYTAAIRLETNGGNTIQGNYLGTDVNGTAAVGSYSAIHILNTSTGNTIGGTAAGDGNLISGNLYGIRIEGDGGNVVQGNLIGTDVNGTADLGNTQEGIWINGSPDNTIGGTVAGAGNVISGNDRDGVQLSGSGATGSVIQGNYIGTDVNGTSALGNGRDGVRSNGSPDNRIGGAAAGAGNVISGNGEYGVFIDGPTGNVVQGNFVGTDVNGTADLGNALAGVSINLGSGNTIGGTEAGEGNLISGNDGDGVAITAGGNLVEGNLIGTDISGGADLGNSQSGVYIAGGGSEGNVIGGTEPGTGNVISGNDSDGVRITGGGNEVEGNFIGTDTSGSADLGNGGNGVYIQSGDSAIGGTAAGAGNVIAFNGGDGVFLVSLTTNAVRGNSIHSQAGLGIDLQPDGVRENVQGDFIYANNFPVIALVAGGPTKTTIVGNLHSRLDTTFNIDFYSNSGCDPSGNGEGETYLGSVTKTTDANGDVGFRVDLSTAVPAGHFITATATELDGGTSEFSDCAEVLLDSDEDGVPDVVDNCPSVPTPWVVPVGDSDCDGFTDGEEESVGTDAADACGIDAWPPDFDNSQTVNVLDFLQLTPPVFNSCSPDPPYTVRKDLNADGCVNILDILRLTPPMFNQSCTP